MMRTLNADHAIRLLAAAAVLMAFWFPNITGAQTEEKLTPEQIDQRFAKFVEANPDYDSVTRNAREIRELLGTLDAGQLRGIFERYKRTDATRMFPFYFANRLGELEGEKAAEYLLAQPRSEYRSTLGNALQSWAKRDPDAAFAWAVENVLGYEAFDSLMGAVWRHHSDRVEGFLAHPRMQNTAERKKGLRVRGQRLVRENPSEGLAWLESLSPADKLLVVSESRYVMRGSGVIAQLAKALPAESARVLLSLPKDLQRRNLDSVIGNWAMSDPEAAMAWVDQLPAEHVLRNDAKWLALAIWADIDVAEAWQYLSALPSDEAVELLKKTSASYRQFLELDNAPIVFRKARKPNDDRPQIASYVGFRIRGISRSIGGEPLHSLLLDRMSADQRSSLLDLAKKSGDAIFERSMLVAVANHLTYSDPLAAIELAKTLDEDGAELMRRSIDHLAQSDPVAALEIAMSLDEGREERVTAIAGRWAITEPAESRAHFEAMPPGPNRDTALAVHEKTIAINERRNDLVAARAHYLAQPPGRERGYAFTDYVRLLMESASVEKVLKEVDAFIAAEKFDPRTSYGSDYFVRTLLEKNPQAVARWAATKPESYLRYRSLRQFWEYWEKYGEGVGAEKLKALGLKESEIRSSRY